MKFLGLFMIMASLLLCGFATEGALFTTKAYANKMDGKPGGGRNTAHYDNPMSKKKKESRRK